MSVGAPYRFAPIHDWVHFPKTPPISHDVPFEDGLCGTIGIEIEAVSPILAGGARRAGTEQLEGEVWPFQLPDGSWALPPATLQGMCRSILEIAAFGKLGPWIENDRFKRLLRNACADHLDEDHLDLPSMIFGIAGDLDTGGGLKRRASFDVAFGELPADGKLVTASPFVLLDPKPSYYPAYIRQPADTDAKVPELRRKPIYATLRPYRPRYADERRWLLELERDDPVAASLLTNPQLAGVKIWPTTETDAHPQPLPEKNKAVQTWLRALPPKTVFETTLRVHNLRPFELGAVLWALTFGRAEALAGADSGLRHRLGMGKPYRLGAVSIRIKPGSARLRKNKPDCRIDTSPTALIGRFEAHMRDACRESGKPVWENTAQVRSLLKAADPKQNTSGLDYMPLGKNSEENSYLGERAAGRYLPPYVEDLPDEEPPDPRGFGVGARVRTRKRRTGTITGRPEPHDDKWPVRWDDDGRTQYVNAKNLEIIG